MTLTKVSFENNTAYIEPMFSAGNAVAELRAYYTRLVGELENTRLDEPMFPAGNAVAELRAYYTSLVGELEARTEQLATTGYFLDEIFSGSVEWYDLIFNAEEGNAGGGFKSPLF